jgi:quercetin dioxygenase-like cupin family protein
MFHVLAGSGQACDRDGMPKRVDVGDIIWHPPGTTRWQGADDSSYMVHQAVSFGGVKWLNEMRDEECSQKSEA